MKKLLFVGLLCLSFSALAGPTYNVTDNTQVNIGNQFIDTNWDKLFLDGFTGTYGPGNGFEKIGEFQFTAGPNYFAGNYVPTTGVFDFLMDVAGVTKTINLNWAWSSNGPVDFLDFTNLTDTVFGNYIVEFHNFNAGTDVSSNGNTGHTDLMIKVRANNNIVPPNNVPELQPLTLLLLGAGVFLIGVVKRHRC